MFKIWLKSDEFEGIKNSHQRLMIFLEFLLELMIIFMFLMTAGAGVLDNVLDGLLMP